MCGSTRSIEGVRFDRAYRVDSLTHAAPLVTMDQYQKIIADGHMDEPRIIIKGLVDAYGLKHKFVIEELLSASHGYLKNHLDEIIEEFNESTLQTSMFITSASVSMSSLNAAIICPAFPVRQMAVMIIVFEDSIVRSNITETIYGNTIHRLTRY
jgi:hypothetical protein